MRYLTVEEIIHINVTILETDAQLLSRNMFESAVARPQMSVFGEDAYATLTAKGAALMHSLVLNHPFMDGNKRTATLALVAFLNLNGRSVNWEPSEALNFIVEIAEGKHDVPAITRWLDTNTN